MRVGLIGATGALGRRLAEKLRQAGHEPIDGDRSELDPAAFVEATDAIVIVAAHLARRDSSEAHASLRTLLLAAASHARRVLLLSSTAVYGVPQQLPCREGDWKRPRSELGRRLWALEQVAHATRVEAGACVVVLRPAVIYGGGVGGAFGAALAVIALFARGTLPRVIPRRGPIVHLVHLDDVIAAAIFLATRADGERLCGQVFHVADDAPLSLEEFLVLVLSGMGERRVRHRAGWLAVLLRLGARLARRLPRGLLVENLERRLVSDWARLTRRHQLTRRLLPLLPQLLCALAGDAHFDTGRLARLGFSLRHPTADEALPIAVQEAIEGRLLPALAEAAAEPALRSPEGPIRR